MAKPLAGIATDKIKSVRFAKIRSSIATLRVRMSYLEVPPWWDRDVDRTGREIRLDVRSAAIAVWKNSYRRMQGVLGDSSQAAELLEYVVAQVSRYLDRKGIAVFSRAIEGLVAHCFQRAIQHDLAKRSRLVSWDGEFPKRAVDETWLPQMQARLELQQIVERLCEKSRTVLALRYAGYNWKETADSMGESVAALRSAFWRDVNRVKFQLTSAADHSDHQSRLRIAV